MLLDYYGRVVGLSIDHPDNDPESDADYYARQHEEEQQERADEERALGGACHICGEYH